MPARRGPAPRAVIFDLDGTLTEPLLDFDAMRAEIGLAPGCRSWNSWPTATMRCARARTGAAPARARCHRARDAGRRLL